MPVISGKVEKMNASGTWFNTPAISGEFPRKRVYYKTNNTTYFRALKKEKVTEHCIAQWNDDTRAGIMEINNGFDLVFVNWHHNSLVKDEQR